MPAPPQSNDGIVGCRFSQIENVHQFSHQAMATVFELFIVNEDRDYASQGAHAAFNEADRLEIELSRFIENSDISRLNHAAPNTPITLGMEAFQCLSIAKQAFAETNGAFDASIGRLYRCWLNGDRSLRTPSEEERQQANRLTSMDHLTLDTESLTAEVAVEGLQFDLGGIGKGFAAEKMGEILKEWSLPQSLILAGASSVLALDPPTGHPGWPVTLSHPKDRSTRLQRLDLARMAVAGSGLERGRHIIDPRPNKRCPVDVQLASWSLAPDATTADALSTAFMVMEPHEIEQFCSKYDEAAAMIVTKSNDRSADTGRILRFGNWPQKS